MLRFRAFGFAALMLTPVSCLTVAAADKPNVVVILADDLGYNDIGVFGCPDIPTPHIDSIAKNGVRFTDGYANNMVCSASRAGFLSGMYQQRFGFENNSGPERYAAPHFGIPREIPTVAERLKRAGYTTGMAGKWHVGFNKGLRPENRGFDFAWGFRAGARNFFPQGRQAHTIFQNGNPVPPDFEYLTDKLGELSADFIEQNSANPFFLYVAFNAVHVPMEATRKYLDRFPNIDDPNRRTLAGMLSAMDDAVGLILATLRSRELEENTLIFFYSDNGGATGRNFSRNDPLRGQKGTMFEGGIRVPFMMQWKGHVPPGQTYHHPVMGFDCSATALAVAGVRPKSPSIDGVDLIPFVTGQRSDRPHETLFWRAGPKHAARVGDWKLVTEPGQPTMLFNLKDDLSEQHDLSQTNRQDFARVNQAYLRWDAAMMEPRWIRQDKSNAEVGGLLKPEAAKRRGKRRS